MNDASTRRLRDIGILAHIDAGKTSLTERLLYVSGRIRSPGDIDDGTTVTDYLEIERERGITVKAAAIRLEWDGLRINLIDTPGHVDFSSEVGRSLRALDGAVVLVCAVAGVQSRTEVLYRACAQRRLARLVFVNKMDRRGAGFDRALGDLRSILDPGAIAVQLPWGEGEALRGVVDLVAMKAYDFSLVEAGNSPSPRRPRPLPIPAELAVAARAGQGGPRGGPRRRRGWRHRRGLGPPRGLRGRQGEPTRKIARGPPPGDAVGPSDSRALRLGLLRRIRGPPP